MPLYYKDLRYYIPVLFLIDLDSIHRLKERMSVAYLKRILPSLKYHLFTLVLFLLKIL